MNYKYPDFEYLAVPEFQKRGAVHYHLLCDLPFVEVAELQEAWGQGFVKINKIDNVNNVGAYVSKYLGKEMDERSFGKKKFFCSRNLKKPVELIKYPAIDFFESYVSELTPIFEKIFYSDYAGKIEYSAYTLPEDIFFGLNLNNKNNATERRACFGISEIIQGSV